VAGRKVGDENHIVVIENQFGKTNHDHLGKLLTYAAVNEAMTGIWISEKVSDDHRKVIDWLNDNTPPQVSFYLVELKAYCIGDSPVAPELFVVCRPNMQTKIRDKAKPENQDRALWRKEFWEDVLSFIKEQNPPFRVQSAGVDSWSAITVGRSGFCIALSIETRSKRVCCQLIINPAWRLSAFEQLHTQREAIEQEIGSSLEWQALPDMKISRIKLYADLDPTEPSNHEEIKVWMNRQANAFYRAFPSRVQSLNADETAFLAENQVSEN
jgi:hypothetical protein